MAINPATPLDHLRYVLDLVDMVLIMSVNPGFGGQAFIPQVLEKIATLRANVIVSGSGIFEEPDYRRAISEMRERGERG